MFMINFSYSIKRSDQEIGTEISLADFVDELEADSTDIEEACKADFDDYRFKHR